MFCPLMMDPRIGWIQPEQKGPAFKTWSNVLEDVNSPSTNLENLRDGRADYIPLNRLNTFNDTVENTTLKNLINEDKNRVSKKKKVDNGTPWWSKDKKYPDGVVGLHEEMLDFYNFMKPRKAEHAMRGEVISRVQEVIKRLWPAAEVEVYGSYKTGLYLPTSDIDIVVFGQWERAPLWTLEQALTANKIAEASSIKVLDKASVPIIKLTDQRSKVKVDISFNVPAGLKAAEFITDQMEIFPCLPHLVLVLKQFLVQRDLNEVFSGGISSYSLVLMVVSFLQQHPRRDGRTLKNNLGVLLIEFFELYGRDFNYGNVGIRVKDGGTYFNKQEVLLSMDDVYTPNYALLCIEDPFTEGNYMGKSSYKFMDVKLAFDYAFTTLSKPILRDVSPTSDRIHPEIEKDPGGYLGRIVAVQSDTVEYREWVDNMYSAPLISQLSPTAPTYASIANRHVQTQAVTSQEVSGRSATWPRSQSNVETLLVENRVTMENEHQSLVKHPSADCLFTIASGMQMNLNTNSVWTAPSVRKLADSLAQDNVSKRKVNFETRTSVSGVTPKSLHLKPANAKEASSLAQGNSYSGAIKQSVASPSKVKQTFTTSTKTCVVESMSKSNLAATSSRSELIKTSVTDPASNVKTVSLPRPTMSSTKTSVVESLSKSNSSYVSGLASTKAPVVDSVAKPKSLSASGSTVVGLQKKTDEQMISVSTNNNAVVCTSPKLDLKFSSHLTKDNGIGKKGAPTTVSIQTKNNNNNHQNNNNNKSNNITVSKSLPIRKKGKPKSRKGKST